MTTPKEGIFIRKNARGFYFTFKQNGDVLCSGTGYDTKQACRKGIMGVARMCKSSFMALDQDLPIVDLTKAKSANRK